MLLQRKKGHRKAYLFLACCMFVSLLALAGCSYSPAEPRLSPTPSETPSPEVFQAGIRINGVDIGGLTAQEAQAFFYDAETLPDPGIITIVNGELSVELDASSIKGEADLSGLFAQALAYNEKNPVPEGGVDFSIEYSYDLTPLKDQIAQLAEQLTIPAQDAAASYQPAAEGKFEYTPSQDGQLVESDALFAALQEYVNFPANDQPLVAPVVTQPAAISLEDVQTRTQLVSTATSSFKKGSYSAANRVDNIEKALNMIDGYVLNPGETFSFNEVLGPRYSSLGWKSAGAINGGKSVQEPGGGVCQVSSTAFNAVLMADLTVVERSPHSWPLSYLPAGQDATINTGAQDFRFRNDRETPVIISATIDRKEKNLTISIYGEPLPDGKTIKLVSEKTDSIRQPADEIVEVSSMPAGTSQIDREGRSGSKYDTYKEYYDANGNLIERVLSHKSTYRAISTVIHKGPDLPSNDTIPEIPSEDEPSDVVSGGGSVQIPEEDPAPNESDQEGIIVVG